MRRTPARPPLRLCSDVGCEEVCGDGDVLLALLVLEEAEHQLVHQLVHGRHAVAQPAAHGTVAPPRPAPRGQPPPLLARCLRDVRRVVALLVLPLQTHLVHALQHPRQLRRQLRHRVQVGRRRVHPVVPSEAAPVVPVGQRVDGVPRRLAVLARVRVPVPRAVVDVLRHRVRRGALARGAVARRVLRGTRRRECLVVAHRPQAPPARRRPPHGVLPRLVAWRLQQVVLLRRRRRRRRRRPWLERRRARSLARRGLKRQTRRGRRQRRRVRLPHGVEAAARAAADGGGVVWLLWVRGGRWWRRRRWRGGVSSVARLGVAQAAQPGQDAHRERSGKEREWGEGWARHIP
eukprot:Rhum_TRINITY_DN11380_c1_g1::Rhum_TRINITY_DN11380_c1_g1_i1::g.44272::m.44272